MNISHLVLITLLAINCLTPVLASSTVTITKLTEPAWIQQTGSKTKLGKDGTINYGDRVITGDDGQVEMQLISHGTVKLNENSEITIQPEYEVENSDQIPVAGNKVNLYVQQGSACIETNSSTGKDDWLRLIIGETTFVVMQDNSHVCSQRDTGLSVLKLLAGSIQVTHSVDQNVIILSKAGTEFRIDDKGEYEMRYAESKGPYKIVSDKSVAPKFEVEEKAQTNASNIDSGEIIKVDMPSQASESKEILSSGYSYTVYLFSSRSIDVAESVNEKVKKAGHDSEIITSTSNDITRYRIAVGGFNTRGAAQKFSDSIVGTLGIGDTWVGKEAIQN